MKNKRTVLTMLLARRVCGWSARQLLKPRPIRTAFKSSTRAAPLMSVVDKESMDYVDVDTELAAPAEDVVVGEETPIEDAEPEKDPMAIEGRISDRQAERLAQRGITTFTEIQHRSYEPVFEGRDLLGKSRTGTGKTVAFGLPIIEKLAEMRSNGEYDHKRRGRGPAMLVLTPTRELAKQVHDELKYLADTHGFSTTCFHGGVSYGPQEGALRRGVDILVATVGRVIDHIDRGNLHLNDAYHVVLDEADEMLSMGFADDVERIFGASPCPERVARHLHESSPSEKALGALFFEFELIRTPRR